MRTEQKKFLMDRGRIDIVEREGLLVSAGYSSRPQNQADLEFYFGTDALDFNAVAFVDQNVPDDNRIFQFSESCADYDLDGKLDQMQARIKAEAIKKLVTMMPHLETEHQFGWMWCVVRDPEEERTENSVATCILAIATNMSQLEWEEVQVAIAGAA